MKVTKFLPIIALFVGALVVGPIHAQIAGDFRWNGTASQDVNDAASWQTFNGTSWVAAGSAPSGTSRIAANNTINSGQITAASPIFSAGDVRLNVGTAAGNWAIGTQASASAFSVTLASLTTSDVAGRTFGIFRANTLGSSLNVNITGDITTSSTVSTNVDLAPGANRLDDLTVGGKITINQTGRVSINALGTVSLQEIGFGTTATSSARFDLASGNIASAGETVVRTVNATGISGTSGMVAVKGFIGQVQSSTATLALSSSDDFSAGAVLRDYTSSGEPLGSATLNLSKAGSGTQVLTGASTYSGTTTVTGGSLLINGSGSLSALGTLRDTAADSVSVNGGTFGGSGTVNRAVIVGGAGTLQGGSGVADTLTIGGNLSLLDNSTISLGLGSDANTHSVLARTGGTWSFDSDQAFSFFDLGGAVVGTTYAGIITGLAFDPGVSSWMATNGWNGTFDYSGGNVNFTLTAIPEPSTIALGAAALLLLVILRRRSKVSV